MTSDNKMILHIVLYYSDLAALYHQLTTQYFFISKTIVVQFRGDLFILKQIFLNLWKICFKYQPSGEGGAR